MEKINQKNLRIIHLGADPEFNSPVSFEEYFVEIISLDNAFSAIQWITANGLPDGVVCEEKLPAGNGFDFFDFWIDQFDFSHRVPFFVLEEEQNDENLDFDQQFKIDEVLFKPIQTETLIKKLIQVKNNKNTQDSLIITQNKVYKPYQISFFKRSFDLICGLFGLLITSPVMFLLILAIRIESRGKAWHTTQRVGSGFKVFRFHKLRSTYLHPDSKIKELSLHNPNPKITKVGQFIRKFSLDELPQVINLLKGDLSLVGNRPLAMYEAEQLTTTDWINRIYAPAGVTGFWKIEPKRKWRNLSPEERKTLDNKYAELAEKSNSFWNDLWIIMRTIPVILRRRNES